MNDKVDMPTQKNSKCHTQASHHCSANNLKYTQVSQFQEVLYKWGKKDKSGNEGILLQINLTRIRIVFKGLIT
jgi:hypothetical protein